MSLSLHSVSLVLAATTATSSSVSQTLFLTSSYVALFIQTVVRFGKRELYELRAYRTFSSSRFYALVFTIIPPAALYTLEAAPGFYDKNGGIRGQRISSAFNERGSVRRLLAVTNHCPRREWRNQEKNDVIYHREAFFFDLARCTVLKLHALSSSQPRRFIRTIRLRISCLF